MSARGAPGSTSVKALNDLLLSLFSSEEFRRWLRLGPDADICDEIPGEAASDAAVVDHAVAALMRRGKIKAEFFVRLLNERPARVSDILAVEALWAKATDERGAANQQARWRMPPIGKRWWLVAALLACVAVLVVAPYVAIIRPPLASGPLPTSNTLKIVDPRWRAPRDWCKYSGTAISTASATNASLAEITKLGSFKASEHAVLSFELLANTRVKIRDIEVLASAQRAPKSSGCTARAAGEDAHLFGVVLAPTATPQRFAAELQGQTAPGSIWLDPGRAEEFYLLMLSRERAIYDIHAIYVSYTVDGQIFEVAQYVERRIAFD